MCKETIMALAFFGLLFVGILFNGILLFTPSKIEKERIVPPDCSDTSDTKIKKGTADRSTTDYTYLNAEKNVVSKKSQKTIYVYKEKQFTLCPFCDGENEFEAMTCNICRRNL